MALFKQGKSETLLPTRTNRRCFTFWHVHQVKLPKRKRQGTLKVWLPKTQNASLSNKVRFEPKKAGRYYLTCLVEQAELPKFELTGEPIENIDLGLKEFAILTDGTLYYSGSKISWLLRPRSTFPLGCQKTTIQLSSTES